MVSVINLFRLALALEELMLARGPERANYRHYACSDLYLGVGRLVVREGGGVVIATILSLRHVCSLQPTRFPINSRLEQDTSMFLRTVARH